MNSVQPGLQLFERLARGVTAHVMTFQRRTFNTWRRTIAAVGGYKLGDFVLTEEDFSPYEMKVFFDENIGRRIVESTGGITTWEGEIVRMELTLQGVTYAISLDYELWHNRVKVAFTDNATSVPTATAWVEDTTSSAIYGECEYLDTVNKNYDLTAAEALRDRRLNENAYPSARPEGGLQSFVAREQQQLNILHVYCAGYVFSMNRRYLESLLAAAAVSDQITTLVGNSEFVTVGQIDTNALSMPVECSDISQRLWNAIEDLILVGDASGNRWVGGVYADRRFYYNLAETTVTHYWRNGQLYDLHQIPMLPTMIKPDTIVRVTGAIPAITTSGANTWANASNMYVDEVEFIAPDQYRLLPAY